MTFEAERERDNGMKGIIAASEIAAAAARIITAAVRMEGGREEGGDRP